jgi:Protein of unknown function (DUF3667)
MKSVVPSQTVCKNCNHLFAGSYCNQCGQKASVQRISFQELFHPLSHALLHVDSGFFYTLKELAIRPGHTIREYVQGKRKNHFHPFTMMLILGGFCSFLYQHFNLVTVLGAVRFDTLSIQHESMAHKYFAYRSVFFCAVCSLGDFLFFFRKKYSLPEMLVANSFMFCGILLLQIAMFPVLRLAGLVDAEQEMSILMVVASVVYLIITRLQFYEAKGHKLLTITVISAVLLYLLVIVFFARLVVHPMLSS